jgi:hypothetical protein
MFDVVLVLKGQVIQPNGNALGYDDRIPIFFALKGQVKGWKG